MAQVFSGGKWSKSSKKDVVALVYNQKPKGKVTAVLDKKVIKRNRKRKAHGILSVFPAKKYCRLIYTDQNVLSSANIQSQFGTEVIFSLAAAYQPRLSGTNGYRPQGFDQMGTAYSRYRVHACKVDVEFFDPSLDGLVVGCQPQSSSDTATITGSLVKTFDMEKWAYTKFLTTTGSQRIKYSRYFNLRALEGLNKIQYQSNASYSGTNGANPTLTPELRLAVANTDSATVGTCKYIVRMEFYLEWYDRIILPSST